ncbi:MAG: serine hydrolase [Rickettsiales bacterium]|nr:serine hydrolase [Rickettsiales bacterium]
MRSKLIKIFAVVVTLILIIQIPSLMKSKIPAEFKDPENINVDIFFKNKSTQDLGNDLVVKSFSSSENGVPIAYSSADVKYEGGGYKVSQKTISSKENPADLVFSIDSNAKMITAAAILRMTEEEKYKKYFPQGIETPLSSFIDLLQTQFPEPENYFKKELLEDPNYAKITIKDLALHTSGLLRTNKDSFPKKILADHRKLTLGEMTDAKKADRDGSWGQKHGEYLYNNIDYEILGRILISVANREKEEGEKEVSFSDIINQLVIDRVKEKIRTNDETNGEELANNLKYFTSDQMEYLDGETRVKGHEELRIVKGKHFYDEKFTDIPSHFYDLACGGAYADAQSQALIAMHVLAKDEQFSIFTDPKTLKVFNETQTSQFDGKDEKTKSATYGFGYMSFSQESGYQQYRKHGGGGYDSNSNSFIDSENHRSVFTAVAFEDLTLPLAYALTNKEKPTEPVRLDAKLYEKSLELSKSYSESQLLEMRNGLEKSYEDFREKFDAIQKQKIDALDLDKPKPSANPQKTHVEKMVGVSKSGYHEI